MLLAFVFDRVTVFFVIFFFDLGLQNITSDQHNL